MAEAYAKLVGRTISKPNEDKEFLVTDLPCTLGRAMMPGSTGGFIVVDQNDNLLSRQHAEIIWLLENKSWGVKCLSKNGFTVDKKRYEKDEIAPLKSGSAIRLGNSRLYFLLPILTSVSQPVGSDVANVIEKKRKAEAPAADEDIEILNEGDSILETTGDENVKSKKPSQSYSSMIEAAFASGELGKCCVSRWLCNTTTI